MPQFLSTLIVFSAIIVVSQLVRLSSVLVAFGLTLENILLPFLYIIVPFLPIIIPMSYLYAVMISFSRLSSDGELTALLAAGYSLRKALAPVLLVASILYGSATTCAVYLEAWGRREFVQFIYRKTQTEIDNMIRFKIQEGVFLNDFLDYVLYTEKISPDRTRYSNVLLAPRNADESPFVMTAPHADITGSVAEGQLRMTFYDGMSYAYNHEGERTSTLKFQRAEIDLLRVFQEKILGADAAKDDYRSYRPSELKAYLSELAKAGHHDDESYWKASYLYYSRMANALMILSFALFGMILGISEQRHGKNRGYIGTVLTIIATFVTLVAFRWLAEKGHLPPLVAVAVPQIAFGLLAFFCFYQKNRLPPSEPLWALRNLPWPLGRS